MLRMTLTEGSTITSRGWDTLRKLTPVALAVLGADNVPHRGLRTAWRIGGRTLRVALESRRSPRGASLGLHQTVLSGAQKVVALLGPMQVAVTKEQVQKAPNIERHGEELSQADESALYHHYELNYIPPATESGRRLARR
jgi:hypothetical protein